MLIKFYKDYLSQFYLARLLRFLVGKTIWVVRWKLIYPIKLVFTKLFCKVFFCVSFIMGPPWDFFFVNILRPLARRFLPRRIRTILLSLDIRRIFFLFNGGRELPLLAFTEAVAAGKIKSCAEIFLEEKVVCSASIIFPSVRRGEVSIAGDSYTFPTIAVAEVANAKVTGLSNFIESNGEVFHHDLYKLSHDYTSEELHGRFAICPERNVIRKFDKSDDGSVLEVAAVFTDSCSTNYAHWLTEVLPRIHVGAKFGVDKNIPFIVDAGLHPNLLSSASLLAGPLPLVELKKGESIHVKKLYAVGATGYIPFDRRPAQKSGHSHGIFSPSALNSMRAQLASLLGVADCDYPKKIILRRSSGTRVMKNEEALALKLQELGFSSIYPEKLTFSQQYHLFSNAECVVGATGAAMANLIFCKPACRVIICISSYKAHNFGYWINMASATGKSLRYVLGPVVGEKNQGIHADFMVSVDDVLDAVNA